MNRPLLIAAFGLVVAGAAIGLNYYGTWEDDAEQAAARKPAAEAPEPAPAAKPEPAPAAEPADSGDEGGNAAEAPAGAGPKPPSFDVVRVNPQGDTVIAGRAEPGATVTVLDDGDPIGRVTADANGEWVFLPDKPLPPGKRRLRLRMPWDDGEPVLSAKDVLLVVPERDKDIAGRPVEEGDEAAGKPLALQVPRQGKGPTRVLQKPSKDMAALPLSVDAVDYDDAGNLTISGQAPPGSLIQVYLNDRFVGRVRAGGEGRWRLSPEQAVEPGLYTLRADRVDDQGKVLARVSFPFSRAEPMTGMDPDSFIVVQPGNSLWRIARRVYGTGYQYTVIYEANEDQIGDPDLIYPGQVFMLPESARR